MKRKNKDKKIRWPWSKIGAKNARGKIIQYW